MKDKDRLLDAAKGELAIVISEADRLKAELAAEARRADAACVRADEAEAGRAAVEQAFAAIVIEKTAAPR